MDDRHGARKIGEILVDLKVLKPSDVARVLEMAAKRNRRHRFGRMARDMGLVTEEQILAALAVQMKLLPGIERMTLSQILYRLGSEATAV